MVDSTLFGDDRARQGDSARTAPDVALLEHLVDEYEQLDVVMDELAGPTSGSPVKGKAWKGDRHERRGQAAAAGSAAGASSASAITREPRRARRGGRMGSRHSRPTPAPARSTGSCSSHHQRVYQAIGDALPRLRNPRVREEVTKLQEHLGKEIAQLKAGPLP